MMKFIDKVEAKQAPRTSLKIGDMFRFRDTTSSGKWSYRLIVSSSAYSKEKIDVIDLKDGHKVMIDYDNINSLNEFYSEDYTVELLTDTELVVKDTQRLYN